MSHKKHSGLALAIYFLTALLVYTTPCYAQQAAISDLPPETQTHDQVLMQQKEVAASDVKETQMSLLDLIRKGGVVGYLIILLSVVSVGLIIDYSFAIRKSKMLPSDDISTLKEMIKNRDLTQIDKFDHARASFLSKVAVAGLKEAHMGYESIIKAMEDAGEALTSHIARRIEHLNVIGNISPMLGLLGTVVGMLRCFNQIAHVAGAVEPKQLAGGIFEALITTCLGLIVAIPALYCYAIFRNRVDEYTAEASLAAEQLMSSFKSDPNGN